MARLRIKTGKDAGKTTDIQKSAVVGRGETATVQIQDGKASREHFKVFEQGGQWAVADLNSRNGIKVNGVQTTRKNLSHGDEIEVGETVLVFEMSGAAAPAKPAAPVAKAPAAGVDEIEIDEDGPPAKPAPAAKAPAPAPKGGTVSAATAKKEAMLAEARASAQKGAAKPSAPAKSAPAAKGGKAGAATAEGGVKVSDHVLQFNKVDPKSAGLMDIDLSQSTTGMRTLVFLGCIAVLAAICWAISLMMG
ncbi:MAG: hypothetical protein HMLKMBBP_00995 [Planctomycetes bacterium]|nr:hypothetical protein [Planctomycetota bacterium]